MKDFESFYSVKIQPQLPGLIKQNRNADVWGVIMVLALLAAAASFVINIIVENYSNGTFITLLLFGFAIYSVYAYTKKESAFSNSFKTSVIKEVIDYLHPSLMYNPNKSVSSTAYTRSGLYRKRYDYFEGDDYLEGTYKNVYFQCSELHTSFTKTYRQSETSRKATIFKGLFFEAFINEKFTAGTYVWIKNEEQLSAKIAGEHFGLLDFPRTAHVIMGYDLFDDNFSVYSTNPQEASEILNMDMMNNLLLFRKQIRRRIVFSVVAGRCYVAIPVKEDLFEPAKSLGDKEAIKKYFFSVLLILSIINQLQLNKLR
jgi:hypothetical protein